MQDSSGTIGLRRSRPVSRRDALRYATAVSALAGLGAAQRCRRPRAAAAAPTLIDFAMRQIPAQDIRAAGYAGVINYVSLSRPGSSFGAKPITRPYAESLTAAGLAIVSNYQYGKPGGTAPSDFTAGSPAASPTLTPPGSCNRGRWRPECTDLLHRRRRHQPRHLEHRRAAVVSRNQLGARSAAHRRLRGYQCVPVGHRRWRDREFEHGRPPVGLADPVLVSRSGLPRRSSLPTHSEHRVESRPGGRRARSRRQRRPGPGFRPVEPTSVRS